MDHLREMPRPSTHGMVQAWRFPHAPDVLAADGTTAIAIALGSAAVVLWVLYCNAGALDALLAAACRALRDHDMAVRDLGRALQLARSLRGQAAVAPVPWPVAAQALWQDLKARTDTLPGIGSGLAGFWPAGIEAAAGRGRKQEDIRT